MSHAVVVGLLARDTTATDRSLADQMTRICAGLHLLPQLVL